VRGVHRGSPDRGSGKNLHENPHGDSQSTLDRLTVIPAKAGIQLFAVIPAKAGIQPFAVIPAKAGIQMRGESPLHPCQRVARTRGESRLFGADRAEKSQLTTGGGITLRVACDQGGRRDMAAQALAGVPTRTTFIGFGRSLRLWVAWLTVGQAFAISADQ
jgi:hypothetical protein